jgi:hypothetical protein
MEAAAVPPDLEVLTSGEREVLEGFLEMCRRAVSSKLVGLSDRDARRSLVPSQTTLLGLVKHLTSVELEWFGMVLGGHAPEELGIPVDDGWGTSPDDTVDRVLKGYRRACEQSRAITARRDLDETVVHPQMGSVSLRWIYVHMIEETARHAGHADILREQTDGSTGVD